MFYVIYFQDLKPYCDYHETMDEALKGIENILSNDFYIKPEDIILIEGTQKFLTVDKEVTYKVRLDTDAE